MFSSRRPIHARVKAARPKQFLMCHHFHHAPAVHHRGLPTSVTSLSRSLGDVPARCGRSTTNTPTRLGASSPRQSSTRSPRVRSSRSPAWAGRYANGAKHSQATSTPVGPATAAPKPSTASSNSTAISHAAFATTTPTASARYAGTSRLNALSGGTESSQRGKWSHMRIEMSSGTRSPASKIARTTARGVAPLSNWAAVRLCGPLISASQVAVPGAWWSRCRLLQSTR